MKRIFVIFIIVSLFLGACSSAPKLVVTSVSTPLPIITYTPLPTLFTPYPTHTRLPDITYTPQPVYAVNLVSFVKDSPKCSHDSIGNMILTGKVENTSSIYDLRFVELRGTIYENAGDIVNTSTSYIDSDILYAGATSTYTIYVDDPNYKAFKCKVHVEDAMFNN